MLETSTEIIGPTEAAEMLRSKGHNRRLRPAVVMRFAGAIERGEWELNGEAVKFSQDGVLLDGQHRLHAVIRAGKPIKTIVLRGLDPSMQDTMDTGAPRTFADSLKLQRYANPSELAAAVRIVWALETKGLPPGTNVTVQATNRELSAMLAAHPGIIASVESACDKVRRSHLGIGGGMGAALHYLIKRDAPGSVDDFFDALTTGADLSQDDAVFVLRRFLLRERQSARRLERLAISALIIKAFDRWRRNEPTTILAWRRDEKFPEIERDVIAS